MDEQNVRKLTVEIMALREEQASYKKEVKRLQEEIEAHDLLRDKAIMAKSDQTRLDLVGPERGE